MLCALIMAGGTGQRFWPLSTEEHPKQLLKLLSDKSMIRETVDRILPLIPAENIYIATNKIQSFQIIEELPMVPKDNIIIEPAFKDTAAAIGFGCLYIRRQKQDTTLVVLASDHAIKDVATYRDSLEIAAKEASTNHTIVTFGIKPTRPEMGYGYLKVQGEIKLKRISTVEAFIEKPSKELAMEFLQSDSYLWNSGTFVFSLSMMLNEIKTFMPKHYRVLKNISFYIDQGLKGERLADKTKLLFDDFEKISIDYGVMEKTTQLKVIPSDFGWNDIGSFTAFEAIYDQDENHNVVRNSILQAIDSEGNIIMTDNLEIKAIGIKDMIIVQSGNKLLLCNKYDIDQIKKI